MKTLLRSLAVLAVSIVAVSAAVTPAGAAPPPSTVAVHSQVSPDGPNKGEIWCYAYSTAAGFWDPILGAAIGATCLFDGGKQETGTSYMCEVPPPSDNGGVLLVPYPPPKQTRHVGRCPKGQWGVNERSLDWIHFSDKGSGGGCGAVDIAPGEEAHASPNILPGC